MTRRRALLYALAVAGIAAAVGFSLRTKWRGNMEESEEEEEREEARERASAVPGALYRAQIAIVGRGAVTSRPTGLSCNTVALSEPLAAGACGPMSWATTGPPDVTLSASAATGWTFARWTIAFAHEAKAPTSTLVTPTMALFPFEHGSDDTENVTAVFVHVEAADADDARNVRP